MTARLGVAVSVSYGRRAASDSKYGYSKQPPVVHGLFEFVIGQSFVVASSKRTPIPISWNTHRRIWDFGSRTTVACGW